MLKSKVSVTRPISQDDIRKQQARCTSKPVASIISKQKYDRMVALAEKSYLRTVFISTPLNVYLKSKFRICESERYAAIIHQGYGYIVLDKTEVLRVKCIPDTEIFLTIKNEYRNNIDWKQVRLEQLDHHRYFHKILPYKQTKTYINRHTPK